MQSQRFLESRVPRLTAPSRSSIRGLLLVSLVSIAGACSGGSSGGGGGTANLETLTGRVVQPGGAGLSNVTIQFAERETFTDSSGAFILPMIGPLPAGTLPVIIDGSTADAVGSFPTLEVAVDVAAGDTTVNLSQVITLPDLDNPVAANQSIAVDGQGALLEAIDAVGMGGDLALAGPVGTVVTIHGEPAQIGVDFNVTPVPANEVPMPLPAELLGAGFATVQPGGASFTTPEGGGLDTLLPNDRELPIGTAVDVWSFDHDVGDWVNRSLETGNTGTVIEVSPGVTAIDADGVITEGGWHSGVVDVDPECATSIIGRVVDGAGNPLSSVSIYTDLGQFATSADDGRFSMPLVPTYDLNADVCTPIDFTLRLAAPTLLGGVMSSIMLGAGQMVPGGTLDVGDIVLDVPSAGCVSGIVNGTPASAGQAVTIDGPTPLSVVPFDSGTFFKCDLAPGLYTASYLFLDELEPTVVSFEVLPYQVTSISLQKLVGGGADTVRVTVLRDSFQPFAAPEPIAGAPVLLIGSDAGSADGLVATTDVMGVATFEGVTGPFTATAVVEELSAGAFPGGTFRRGASIIGIDPPNGEIGLLIGWETEDGPASVAEASTVSGNVIAESSNVEAYVEFHRKEWTGDRSAQSTGEDLDGGVPYTADVPTNVALVALGYTERDDSSSWYVGGFLLNPHLPLIGPGQDLNLDLDFTGDEYVEFGEFVPFTTSGLETPFEPGESYVDIYANFSSQLDGYRALGYLGYFEELSVPATIPLPDPSAPVLANNDLLIEFVGEVETKSSDLYQTYKQRMTGTTPTSFHAAFAPVPTLPTVIDNNVEIELQELHTLALPMSVASVPADGGGFEVFRVGKGNNFAEGPAPKGDGGGPSFTLEWTIIAPSDSTSLTFPQAPGSFVPLGEIDVAVESVRVRGATIDYDSFFSADVASNLDALDMSFESATTSTYLFEIDLE